MKKHPIVYMFFSFIMILTFFDIVKKDNSFSELENRNLARKPIFSISSFLEGKYRDKYEEYINDNFIFGNQWINLKSISEYTLGKLENNNIIYGKENYMFEKNISYDKERFKNNIDSINKFIDIYEGKVTTMIVPNSYTIYEEYIPWGIKLLNQEKLINEVYRANDKDRNIDLVSLFKKNKEEYIYYKTDHHWTTYGVYLAYKAYIESLGEKPIDLNSLKKNEATGFYGTYFSKAKLFSAESDILTYYDIDNITMNIQGKIFESLYDYDKLNIRDKYSVFIRGNNGLTIIENKNIKLGKKLLIFKDSFANSMIPFLSQNFKEIHVVDLRSFSWKVSEYMKNTNFDEILILYNMENFLRDINITRIKY
ncbi:DHHW family protein [Clostridium perfringens]|uniref:DHHW family protein n=1 Tax=Clostridium perfringens TaxID=1502 RepID=UPI003F832A75|nr:DHHW family protein [Clostridium perfringens]MDK0973375.1 DHHW family protein [Clostridium perfringens]